MSERRPQLLVPAAVLLCAAAVWQYGTMRYIPVFSGLASIGYNVLFGLAGIASVKAAARLRAAGDLRGAQGWLSVSIAMLAVLLAQALNILRPQVRSSLAADVLAVTAYPAMVVALTKFSPPRGSSAARTLRWIDYAMLVVAAATVWVAVDLGKLTADDRFVLTTSLYRSIVPTLALVTVTAAGLFFMRSSSQARPGGQLAAVGFVVLAIGDLSLDLIPALWDRWSNVEWSLGALLFVIAAERARPTSQQATVESRTPSVVPFIAVVFVTLALTWTLVRLEHYEPLYVAGGGATLMLLLAIRQWGALQANYELQRRNEEQQRQLREAERLDALGRMARGVAHDFNGMLLSILTNAELAGEDVGHDDEAARESLEHIRSAAVTASGLTSQLLSFARAGTVATTVVDVGEVVRTQWPLLTSTLPQNIEAQLSLPERPLPVRAGVGFVEQVLHNLIVNARDAMPDGGRLVVNITTVAQKMQLSISDTGHGMDETTRARIFEPFFTTKNGRGSGLGLATVYGIVRQSDGDVQVMSAPGEGTTFVVTLPLAG